MKAIIDCNSFYASCEKVFRPELAGRPIVVLSNNDGCIIALNDEAKALGVPMGEPYFKAKDLCKVKGVEVFSSNYALYGDLSRRVMQAIASIYPDIEVYSIDECFLDLEEASIKGYIKDYKAFGQSIIDRVMQWTGVPVSIGIAPTKVLAKVANRLSKKDKARYKGVYVIQDPEDIKSALIQTKVGDVWGVGWQSTKKLNDLYCIYTAHQLSLMSEECAYKILGGVTGIRLIKELNGVPCRGQAPGLDHKKNIMSTRSFGRPVTTLVELKEAIATYTSRAAEKLRAQGSAAGSIYVFARTFKDDNERGWRSDKPKGEMEGRGTYRHFNYATDSTSELIKQAVNAAEQIFKDDLRYKKAGVILGSLVPKEAIQQYLFEENHDDPRNKVISKAMDSINKRMGIDTINFLANGVRLSGDEIKTDWKMRCELRSSCYTTKWDGIAVIGKED